MAPASDIDTNDTTKMPQCVVCLEDRELPLSAFIVHNKHVCHDCIRTLFERAVQSEANYPPKFDNVSLRPSQYRLALPSALRTAFREKEREYKTPIPARIYCKCSAFVTAKITAAGRVRCGECYGCEFCSACGEVLGTEQHTCSSLPTDKDEENAYAGLEKGKDYQICPSVTCRRKVQLIDGCNHITCQCGQHFCFICGEMTMSRSDHWRRGREGCPSWNHPSASNATYLEARVPRDRRAAAQDAQVGEAVVMPPRRGDLLQPDEELQALMAVGRDLEQRRRDLDQLRGLVEGRGLEVGRRERRNAVVDFQGDGDVREQLEGLLLEEDGLWNELDDIL